MEKEYIAKNTVNEIKLEDKDFMLYEVLNDLVKAINKLSTKLNL